MSDADQPATGDTSVDLGPLKLLIEGDQWRFRLTAPHEMTLELPPEYEHELRARLEPLLSDASQPRLVMDLENLPAISSRHLGLMIAIHKVLGDRLGKLHLVNVSNPVRRLLDLTRTTRFFEVD